MQELEPGRFLFDSATLTKIVIAEQIEQLRKTSLSLPLFEVGLKKRKIWKRKILSGYLSIIQKRRLITGKLPAGKVGDRNRSECRKWSPRALPGPFISLRKGDSQTSRACHAAHRGCNAQLPQHQIRQNKLKPHPIKINSNQQRS